MEITIHDVPQPIHDALVARAAAEQKPLDQVTLDAIARGMGVETVSPGEPVKYRDLSDLAGSGGIDEEIEAALWEQRRIDPELWQ